MVKTLRALLTLRLRTNRFRRLVIINSVNCLHYFFTFLEMREVIRQVERAMIILSVSECGDDDDDQRTRNDQITFFL